MEPGTWNRATSKPRIIFLYRQFFEMYLELHRFKRETACQYSTFYRVYPKFHMLDHVITDSPDNPRDMWCYVDESEIGDAADMAASLHQSNLERSLIEKYRVLNLQYRVLS